MSDIDEPTDLQIESAAEERWWAEQEEARMMTDLDLDRLQALADAATPGPWLWDDEGFMGCGQVWTNGPGVEGASIAAPSGDCYPRYGYSPKEDMQFIAAAREAVPQLIERVRAAEKEREALYEYRDYILREGGGTVDQDGTVWANIPVAGPRSILSLTTVQRLGARAMTDARDELVAVIAEALDRVVPNEDGVLWMFDEVVDQRTGMTQPRPVTLTDAARAALSAALPIIREELAQEIEAGIDDAPEVFSESADWVDGMTNAGTIVRGGEGA